MNSLKCAHCGLVYFARDVSCPRCGTSNESTPPPDGRRGSRGALAALACALLLVAGGVVYYLRPARPPAYIKAISSSEKFKQLATVRVNRSPLNRPNGSTSFSPGTSDFTMEGERGVTYAAYVLEARGLLAFNDRITETRTPSENVPLTEHVFNDGRRYYTPGPKREFVSTYRSLNIRLTSAGVEESMGWSEIEEAYGGKRDVPFWRVPVGETELVRVGQVREEPLQDGRRLLTVEVSWRWRPNQLGQTFDVGGQAIGLLPEEARSAAARLGLDSRGELKARAELVSNEDGGWQVVSVRPAEPLAGGDFIKVD